jgi:hypothetical protein
MVAGKRAKKAAGGFIGGRAPYGYATHNKELMPDDAEQEVVKLVAKLHKAGKSLREIGLQLDHQGYRPRDGQHWHPNTIRRIIHSLPATPG